MSELPGGVVTFLFSDIEGSTRLVKALRERYPQVLAEHRRLVRAAIAARGGHEVDTQGDAFFVAFGGAKQAVLCALDIQRALAAHRWPGGGQVRVRIGIHTGQAVPAEGGYTGLAVHRAARISAVAAGGQVLISQATQAVVEDEEEELGFALIDVGERRLKDLDRPVRLFQLAADGLDPGPRPAGLKAVAGFAAGEVHGYPASLTSFVGRSQAMSEVAGLLEQSRLVTVTGPGGSGKTRLAAELARQVAGQFADGAWLVELAPVADPAQVASAAAAALGVQDRPGVPVPESVAQVLARRQLLLVLDNCEHVIGAAAGLCAGLLAAADDVKVLATSQEPLAIAGEARYRLGPLALADPDDLARAAQSEAVALFADRARRADARFVLDGRTAPAVARLVARLDGMPLAIELAAARVEALDVTQLLGRLDDRFVLLAGGDRTAQARHRSLAATVEWSYQLLDNRDRRVFRQISVFPAGFTLEGAEAVAGQDAAPAVLHLVDCSLLAPPRPGPDGRSRYAMLETLRAYGAGLLAQAGEADGAAAALAGYALAVAEEAAAGLQTGTGERGAALWLDAEDATTRQALAWAMDHDPAMAVRLAAALAPWWWLRRHLAREYPLLGAAAEHAAAGSEQWFTLQEWLGWAAQTAADLTAALGHFTTLRDAAAGRAPSPAVAEGLAGRSMVLLNLGRLTEAAGDARRSLALARESGFPAEEVLALAELSLVASYAGDHDGAVQLARQAEEITADIPGSMARVRSWALAQALTGAGDLATAEQVCAEALAQARDEGDAWNQVTLLPQIVGLELRMGRVQDAAAHLREGLQVALRTGSWTSLGNGLYLCGTLCAATGRHAEALTLWAAWAAQHEREGFTESPSFMRRWEEQQREAGQALDPDQARAAEERGAAMSLVAAAEYALMLTTPGPPGAALGLSKLTARERELVTLVAQGCTDAQIAAQLHMSIRSVRSHLDQIRDKTSCRRRADLTRLALTAGLV